MMAKLGETDAAWIAADRAAFCAETLPDHRSRSPPACSGWRTSSSPSARLDQAHHVAASTAIHGLEPQVRRQSRRRKPCPCTGRSTWSSPSPPRATTTASERTSTWTQARKIADRSARTATTTAPNSAPPTSPSTPSASPSNSATPDRPSTSPATSDPNGCHPNGRPGTDIDLAQAHAMRRQIGEALRCLEEAERLTPEQTRTHRVARAVTRDLLQLSGSRPRPELRDLAERFGVLP